jgi:3-phenylpropionate/trans-cinnamate dioxygenase ferredoxin component
MTTKVCPLSALVAGTALRVELPSADVAVVRVGDEVFALEDVCSHAEYPLTDGDVDDSTIECAFHGSRFDLRTGKSLSPPATQPVRTYPVTVIDGDVYIDMETESS